MDRLTMSPMRICLWVLVLLLGTLAGLADAQQIAISGIRVWPAREYTRITLESAQPVEYSVFTAKNPDRLVVDLENVEIGRVLRALPERIDPADPYIAR